MLDTNGNVIMSDEKDKLGKNLSNIEYIKNAIKSTEKNYINEIKEGKENVIIGYAKTHNGLTILATVPEKDYKANYKNTVNKTIITGISLSVLIIILLIYLFEVLVSRKIKNLLNVLEKISNNDFSQELEIKGNDEIEKIKQAINSVIKEQKEILYKLQNRTDNIDSNIENIIKHLITRNSKYKDIILDHI
ncbi:MAG: HAMP domain-containing protein, partial [bacterium]|nr:HAMP domain-containing protein [bacterium]